MVYVNRLGSASETGVSANIMEAVVGQAYIAGAINHNAIATVRVIQVEAGNTDVVGGDVQAADEACFSVAAEADTRAADADIFDEAAFA